MRALQRLRRMLRFAIVILFLPLLRIAPVSAQPVEFKVGISDPVNTVLAIWMADAAGFYAANGIKAEIINMNGGAPIRWIKLHFCSASSATCGS